MFIKDKFVDQKIMELKSKIMELTAWATDPSSKGITEREYEERRLDINLIAIQALTGVEWNEKKDKLKPGKMHNLPTDQQLAEITSIIDNMVNGIELRCRQSFAAAAAAAANQNGEDNDTGIPSDVTALVPVEMNVDLSKKSGELKEILVGKSGIATKYFNGAQCITIKLIGQKIRKDKTIKGWIIIGGIVVVIAVGVIAGFFIYSNHKKKMEAAAIDSDDGDMLDDIQSAETEITDDDMPPHVNI